MHTWDIIRRCKACGGHARKSAWSEDNYFGSAGGWDKSQYWCKGWICEDCNEKIYKDKEIING